MASDKLTIQFELKIEEAADFNRLEKEYIAFLFNYTKGNIFEMNRISKLSRATIYRKLIHHFGGNFREVLK